MASFQKILGASILDADNKLQAIKDLLNCGIKWIHYDVMDGDFVPKVSLHPSEIKTLISKTNEHIVDIHLMVKDVKGYIQQVKDFATYITFHFEAVNDKDLNRIFEKYHDLKIGIAINPHTPLSAIKPYLTKISHVLLMSVEPGLGGQKFNEQCYEKISLLKSIVEQEKLTLFIAVDGGINNETGPECIKHGASMLVSGSYLLNHLSPETINKIIDNSEE